MTVGSRTVENGGLALDVALNTRERFTFPLRSQIQTGIETNRHESLANRWKLRVSCSTHQHWPSFFRLFSELVARNECVGTGSPRLPTAEQLDVVMMYVFASFIRRGWAI